VNNVITAIEVPFDKRNSCWFCGEPATKSFVFPKNDKDLSTCCHPRLSVPSCRECYTGAIQSQQRSIWLIASDVKKYLLNKFKKHLAIGANWTKEELAASEFEGGNFESFQRSAWFMFEIARDRVNYSSWPIVVDGINIENLRQDVIVSFCFDGMEFPCLQDAIDHYVYAYDLNEEFFHQVLRKLGIDKFSSAVRLSRIMVGTTPQERKVALKEL